MEPESALIVVVDDDPDALDWTRRLLEHAGYTVVCFATSREAREYMARVTPELVITDLMMDTLHSGFALAQGIKDNPRLASVPIIVVTGAASQRGFDFAPQGPKDIEAMRVEALFSKPVKPDVLLAKVRALLSARIMDRDTGGGKP